MAWYPRSGLVETNTWSGFPRLAIGGQKQFKSSSSFCYCKICKNLQAVDMFLSLQTEISEVSAIFLWIAYGSPTVAQALFVHSQSLPGLLHSQPQMWKRSKLKSTDWCSHFASHKEAQVTSSEVTRMFAQSSAQMILSLTVLKLRTAHNFTTGTAANNERISNHNSFVPHAFVFDTFERPHLQKIHMTGSTVVLQPNQPTDRT